MKQLFSGVLILVGLSLGGCGYELVDDGSGFLKTKSGELVAWPAGTQITFDSDTSLPNELREQIYAGQEAINEEISRVKIVVNLQRSDAPAIRKSKDEVLGDGQNGIYFLQEPWPWAEVKGKENSDAMTVLINRGNTIIEADIFYRASTYSAKYAGLGSESTQSLGISTHTHSGDEELISFPLSTTYAGNTDLGHDERWTKVAFVHEALHAIGLTHVTKEPDSIMYPMVSTKSYDKPFSVMDIFRLKKLYE